MVSVAARATDGFAAATTITLPLPLPLLPEVIDSHGALLLAVHAQPGPADTLTFDEPPAAGMVTPAAPPPTWHPLVGFTVNVWPPMVSVPVREPAWLAAALTCTVPLPLPLAPAVIDSHDALLVAVHVQP